MDINILKQQLKDAGITGAGGAGFPSYAKLNTSVDTVILNCAECEPLLRVHRQLLSEYAYEILSTLSLICSAVGAKEFVIGIKEEYNFALSAAKEEIKNYPNGSIRILREVYPAGDEDILTYEVTGRIVPAGGIPVDVGVIVYNVETVYNIYKAIKLNQVVTHKYVTITGEVNSPKTLCVPLGTKFSNLIDECGGATVEDAAIIQGGPMTGRMASINSTVSKTTNAIIVLPKEHYLISKRNQKITISIKRALSACCQCKTCTELCPRNLLGHPISPSDFMRSVTSNIADTKALVNTQYCSQCGLCEMYACPQGLSPAMLIGIYKSKLKPNGIQFTKLSPPNHTREERTWRQVPMSRLIGRLDIEKYNINAPLCEDDLKIHKVKISLSQSIGAPSVPIVKIGDKVQVGDLIAKATENSLSLPLHSSICGTVTDVTDSFIVISDK